MAKGKRRIKALAVKRTRKHNALKTGKGKSKYAVKKAMQAGGTFAPTSPFYMPPEERAALEAADGRGTAPARFLRRPAALAA